MNSKSIILFICLTISLSSFAKTIFSVTPATASVYNVNYKSVEAGRIKVYIYNSTNTMVFSEVLNNVSSFSRPYNFSELAEGAYTIVLESKNGKQVEKIDYIKSRLTMLINMKEIANTESKYLLNVTSNEESSVSVKIYSNNEFLHEEQVSVSGRTGIVFNLKQVKSATDSVTFEIYTSNGKVELVTF